MEGIKDRVAIIGMGCTKFGELWDKSQQDLMVDSCYEAFEDAGIDAKDIQAAWLGTVEGGLVAMRLPRAIKELEYIPISRVENMCATGTEAFRQACYAVASGVYDFVLACGLEKLKDTGLSALLSSFEPDARSKVDIVLPPPTLFAMLATRYFSHYGISIEEGKRLLAQISVKNHNNGSMSPKAHLRRKITVEDALKAPIISYPLGLFDCCGVSDGSAAAVITRPELAKKFKDDYVLVKALALCVGGYGGEMRQDFDYRHIEENVRAVKMAYQEAGVTDPRKQISMAEVHDCFTIHELILYEDLGFTPRGKAKEDIEAGTFALDGQLPVNADGGLKCFGHPLGASGLRMIYEVYKQLQGKAQLPERQLKNVEMGLTHNLGGLPHSGVAAISILGR